MGGLLSINFWLNGFVYEGIRFFDFVVILVFYIIVIKGDIDVCFSFGF